MKPCRHAEPEPLCRVCWLYENDPTYRALWDGQAKDPDSGLLARVGNFLAAVGHHLLAGLPKVNEEEYTRRLGLCEACENYVAGSCRLCGCGLRVKAAWAEQKCPAGKW